jgi:uncharacterized protein with HEPN domain
LKDDRVLLTHILKEMVFLKKICQGRSSEDLHHDDYFSHAVIRAIEVIGEASKSVSPALKAANPEIDWREMAGMRDHVIHRYFEINWNIVWDVISNELPVLEPKITSMLQGLDTRNRDKKANE